MDPGVYLCIAEISLTIVSMPTSSLFFVSILLKHLLGFLINSLKFWIFEPKPKVQSDAIVDPVP